MGFETATATTTATATATTTATATSLAPGFRFHPTDEELVKYYLKRKLAGKSLRFDAISVIDIYRFEPWDLPDHSRLKSRDHEWYFFTAQDRKYGNGCRVNRATNKGYWKTTGKDRFVRHNSQTIGLKKTLVYHSGRAPAGERTNWVMHEYRLVNEELNKTTVVQETFVLCKIIRKTGLGFRHGDQYPPFDEEEWNNITFSLPEKEPEDDVEGEGDDLDQEFTQSAADIEISPPSDETDAKKVLPICKIEKSEDYPSPSMDDPEPDPPTHKKPRHNTDPCSSTTTTTATTRNFLKGLLEFPPIESLEAPKESSSDPTPSLNAAADMDTVATPGHVKLFWDLQNEVHKIFVEKEIMKVELMRAQAKLHALHARAEFLSRENNELRRSARGE